jgi:NAD(P)-dependent dehydrogenase (short-subunit alcohol dehydrogenase family)
MIDRFHPAAPPAPRDEFDVGTAAPSERATVMLQYQSLMARFLETQRSVMLAYLGASAVEQRPLPRPERRPLRLQAAPAPSLAQRANVEPVAPPAPPPASEPSGNGAEGNVLTLGVVTQRLLTIVSDRTGYPPEMLNLDLDLEADLGIDSIKRVEILGTFQTWELLSGWKPDDEFMEKLRGHKTLRSIAAFLFETIGGPSPGPDAPGPSAGPPGRGAPPGEEGASHRAAGSKPNGHDREVEETASLDAQEAPGDGPETAPRPSDAPRFVLRLVPSPLPATAREGAAQAVSRADGLIVITDDEGGTAEAVRDRIANLGGRAVVIPAEGAEETLARMRRSEGKIGGVLHLAPLSRATPFDALDHDGWRARITVEAKALHTIVRAVGADLRGGVASGTPFLLAATEEVAASPHRGAVHGLVKCLAWEWPGVLVRAVDFEGEATPAGRAEILLSELAAGGEERVAFWRGDRRAAERPTASPLGLAVDAIDPGAVILVTGGARGITAAIARAIAAHAKATLVITGRSPRPPMEDPADIAHAHSPVALRAALLARAREEGRAATPREIEGRIARILADREIRENLRIMQDAGARVVYRTADARDSVAMGAVIEETYAAFGRIDGAIHGAGVIEDKLLEEKGADSFDRVFDTKADAAFLLARTLRPEGLRFLAFMSSVAGAFGNRGQADYGAANETLNRLATWLDARLSTRVVAINWGPWDAGMATPEVKRQFEARGVRVIPIESGCAAFLDEIASGSKGDPVVVIGEGPWAALAPLEDAPTPGSPATPLLHRERLSMAEGGKLACVRVLDPAFDRYLHHHRLEGKPVLPAAAALALMAEAAQQAWPDLVVTGARDVRVLRGITLRERTLPVRISVRAQTHAPTEATDEVLAAVEITEPESVHRAYYRATILLGTHLPEGPAARHPFLATLPPYPMPIGDAYRKWLFHGPVFQCVRRVLGVSEEGILSEIFPSRPSSCLEGTGDAARWTIDPVLVDGCLQLALLWVRAIHDVTGLPSRMRVVRRYAFDPGTPLTVSLRVLEGSGEANVRSDILCLTPEGKTAFAIDGFEFTCSAALNRLVGWDESLLPPSERGNP